jgi:hypothetical protein
MGNCQGKAVKFPHHGLCACCGKGKVMIENTPSNTFQALRTDWAMLKARKALLRVAAEA